MKTRTIILIMILTVIGVSCIPSLYPLYREKDLLWDGRLVGDFDLDGDLWEFDSLDLDSPLDQGDWWGRYNSGKTFRLIAFEDEEVARFAVHLIMLKDNYYLDFYPVTYRIEHGSLDASLFPAHIFAKLEFAGDNLVIYWFDGEFLNDLIDSNKIRISHQRLPNTLLLTAATDELQDFVEKYGDEPEAYLSAEEPDTLFRMNN